MSQEHLPNVNFKFISDPAHGWLIVSRQWIGAVGLNLAHFSNFSYVDHDGTLALEEDADAPVFLDAYRRYFGDTASLQEIYEPNAHVRSWNTIHAVGLPLKRGGDR